jgi:hypothetical protein
MKTLSLKLPDELDAKLSAAARHVQTSKSEVVRQALDAYLNGGGGEQKGTLLELAGDLIGCLEGPGDLSHNPDHLRDFGT